MSTQDRQDISVSSNNESQANLSSIQDIAQSNLDSIAYDNGIIQKKIYGDQSDSQTTIQLMFHLINRDAINQGQVKQEQKVQSQNSDVISQLVRVQGSLTISQCVTLLEQRLKIAMNQIQARKDLDSDSLDNDKKLGQLIQAKQGQNTDIYVFYSPIKAIIKQKQPQIKYETLNKYSYIDDKKKVKIYIDLADIGSIPQTCIHSRFLQRSIEVKIHGYNGKNWIFAVPKTHCLIRVDQSKVLQKKDKIIISVGKMADSDTWSSLHKVKGVGDKDVD